MLGSFERWPLVNALLGDHGGAPANSPILCVFNAFPARASATTARSTHLRSTFVGELHAARSRGTPTLKTGPCVETAYFNEK